LRGRGLILCIPKRKKEGARTDPDENLRRDTVGTPQNHLSKRWTFGGGGVLLREKGRKSLKEPVERSLGKSETYGRKNRSEQEYEGDEIRKALHYIGGKALQQKGKRKGTKGSRYSCIDFLER